MKKYFYLLSACLALHPLSMEASGRVSIPADAIQVDYLVNSGFMITTPNNKIMIDGLHAGTNALHRDLMLAGQPPFDGITLLLITDSHDDHYHPVYTSQLLENNPQMECCAPPQAWGDIRNRSMNWDAIKDRMHAVNVDYLEKKNMTVQGIPIQAIKLIHGYEAYRDTDILAFILGLNGLKIYHCGPSVGDYPNEYETLGLEKEAIDIAFINANFIWDFGADGPRDQGLERLKTCINPLHVSLHHISTLQVPDEAMGRMEDLMRTGFTSFTCYERPMDQVLLQKQGETVVIDTTNLSPVPSANTMKLLETPAGQFFSYQVDPGIFTDPDPGTNLDFNLSMSSGSPVPAWMLFDPENLIISGIPDEKKRLTLRLTALDPNRAMASVSWQLKVLDTSGLEEKGMPEIFGLSNHPNPFNPATTIQYSLKDPAFVTLSVYNPAGQELVRLVNEKKEAGEYQVPFDGRSIGSGIYMCVLNAGGEIRMKKMMFIK